MGRDRALKNEHSFEARERERTFERHTYSGRREAVTILLIILAIVVLIVGWAVVGLALKLLWWALVGLIIGALARLILPGRQEIGWLATAGAGIAGALLGGIIANALDLGGVLQFIVAVAAAAALIALLGGARRAVCVERKELPWLQAEGRSPPHYGASSPSMSIASATSLSTIPTTSIAWDATRCWSSTGARSACHSAKNSYSLDFVLRSSTGLTGGAPGRVPVAA